MRLAVRFDPAARHEMLEAADFYDFEQSGLGEEFLDEVESALAIIADHPAVSRTGLGETRTHNLSRFPYSVMYWFDEHQVTVTAVAHQRRRPGYWGTRN
jgi:toxin ParE1/3/4